MEEKFTTALITFMSWNHDNHSHEAIWQQPSGSHHGSESRSRTGKQEMKHSRTPPNEGITDGQMSVALDKDLMNLIDNITLELSRSTTIATSRTSTAVSPGGSFVNQDFGNAPYVPNPRFNSHESHIMQSRGMPGPRSSIGTEDVHSRSFRDGYGGVREMAHLEIGSTGYRGYSSRQSVPHGFIGGPGIALRPPVYKGPRSPETVFSSSPRSVRSTKSALPDDPLPQVLHALDDEDDDRIVVVRRITKLGFKSNRIIKAKFNQLGWETKNVVLLPSRSRSVFSDSGHVSPESVSHARPSSMGFVVFESKEVAADCVSRGTINIDGVDVLVQPFVRQYKPTSPVNFQSST